MSLLGPATSIPFAVNASLKPVEASVFLGFCFSASRYVAIASSVCLPSSSLSAFAVNVFDNAIFRLAAAVVPVGPFRSVGVRFGRQFDATYSLTRFRPAAPAAPRDIYALPAEDLSCGFLLDWRKTK